MEVEIRSIGLRDGDGCGVRRGRRARLRRSLAFAVATTLLAWGAGCSEDSGSSSPAPAAKKSTEQGSDRAKASDASKPAPKPESAAPKPAKPAVADTRTEAELVAAGQSVYMANCIACHNVDATKDGALGPAVAGSSLALLEARIVDGNYPEGYTPKRDTRVMVALPHLEPKLKELAVYLESL